MAMSMCCLDVCVQGRVLLWAWMQERREGAGTYTYAGCLSLPRELWLDYRGSTSSDNVSTGSSASHSPSIDRVPQEKGTSDATTAPVSATAEAGFTTLTTEGEPPLAAPRLVQRPVAELAALRKPGRAWFYEDPMAHLALKPTAAAANLVKPFSTITVGPESMQGGVGSRNTSLGALGSVYGIGPDLGPGMEAGDGMGLILGPGEAFPVPQVEGNYFEMQVDLVLEPDLQWPSNSDAADTTATPPQSPPGSAGSRRRSKEIGEQLGVPETFPEPASAAEPGDVRITAEGGGPDPAARQFGAAAPDAGDRGTPQQPALGPLPGRVAGEHPAAVAPPPEGACSGLVLRSYQVGSEGAAAVLYNWGTGVLEVVFEALDPETHTYSLAAPGEMCVCTALHAGTALCT